MQIQFLGQEDHLEEEMATHSSILAWKISKTEEPGGLQSKGSQRVGHDWAIKHTQEEPERKANLPNTYCHALYNFKRFVLHLNPIKNRPKKAAS